MTRSVHIIGGGTISHVRNHLALCAPAYGETARRLSRLICDLDPEYGGGREHYLHLTRMADPTRPRSKDPLETNEDVAALVDKLVASPDTRVIVMNAALCDFTGSVMDSRGLLTSSGKYAERLRTSEGMQHLTLTPAEKIIQRIRKERKDIFLVAFKTTCNAAPHEQYSAALHMLKASSANLVLANDTGTRQNMIVTPEEYHYDHGTDRSAALIELARMTCARSRNTFTRSTVAPDGTPVRWDDPNVPATLRAVVDHCIARGAYKPFRGATVGHFAYNVERDRIIVTSRRKDDFNKLAEHGMVMVEYGDGDNVTAWGGKPSVGGMSQRIIFHDHPDKDCIVHFHSPLREDAPDAERIGRATQQWNECGSHQCGQQTSDTLVEIAPGIAATHLGGHGPNIVFSKEVPAERVVEFIERNWVLEHKTGGLVA